MKIEVFENLDFKYNKDDEHIYHLAAADAFAGWGLWFSGHPPTYFWEGLKKTAEITGTYDPALLSVHCGNFENIEEAEKCFGNLTVARIMINTFMKMDMV
jgi:hypothetical protein